MPEWLVIVVAILGIIVIGLLFTAIDLVRNFARIVFVGIFVFLLVLLANRLFSSDFASSPNGGFSLPPSSGDFDVNVSESLRDLSRQIDEFVFGSAEDLEEPGADPSTGVAGRGDLLYVLPDDSSNQGAMAGQPASSRSGTSSSTSTNTSNRRPVAGMW